jgi:predicted enzyme related to lactoylglutathione lyase
MSRPRIEWDEVTIDCRDPERVAAFWSNLLDKPALAQADGWFQLGPTAPGGPVINFQPVPEEKTGKARVHLDIWVDDFDLAISLVEQLGGTSTGEVHTDARGRWAVLNDPEGTEFCMVALPAS